MALGQRVRLKSGGAIMFVVDMTDDGLVVCAWFDRGGRKEMLPLHPDCLEGV